MPSFVSFSAVEMPESRVSEDIRTYLADRRRLVDAALDRHLAPSSTRPSSIHDAMRYTVLGGGKRVRPILALAAAEACGADVEPLLKPAAALELIHTYSLVHDDLPALDNDDLRRGRKTAHVVYGEALAILTGDALLTEAFAWLAEPINGVDPARQLRAINVVSRAVDSQGMIGGQVADLEAERMQERTTDRDAILDTLGFIHRNKTGRLLTASVLLGGLLAGASDEELRALESYGSAIGLAFQIVDDLLDLEESAEQLGKTAGKDVAQGKLTYPAVVGAEHAREEVRRLLDRAIRDAGTLQRGVNYLPAIARYICERRA